MKRQEEKKKLDDFRIKLGLGLLYVIMTKEESVLAKIIEIFTREKILQQRNVLKYCIDLYIPDYQLAIEVDGKGHQDRDEHKEEEKYNKTRIKIRINADRENFNIYTEIGRIYDHISETKKKSINRQD